MYSKLLKIAIIIIVLAGALAGFAIYAYYKGFHYEYLKSNEYGALTVSIKIRNKEMDPKIQFRKCFSV